MGVFIFARQHPGILLVILYNFKLRSASPFTLNWLTCSVLSEMPVILKMYCQKCQTSRFFTSSQRSLHTILISIMSEAGAVPRFLSVNPAVVSWRKLSIYEHLKRKASLPEKLSWTLKYISPFVPVRGGIQWVFFFPCLFLQLYIFFLTSINKKVKINIFFITAFFPYV